AYGSVREHTNLDQPESDPLNTEMTIKTKGVDEVTIVNILTNCSKNRGYCLCLPEKDQKETCISSEVSLVQPPAPCDASELKTSMKGLGTDGDSLIEIICSRTNQELQEINRIYKEMYKTDLEDIVSDTSGDFCKPTVALKKGRTEDDSVINHKPTDQDAQDL
ncbi:Hypothetical predicted protein, partial [Lynx pardinus]